MSVISTLKERIQSYENLSNFKLLRKLPVVITINGRSFRKTTSLLAKPFSQEFMEAMCATALKLAQEIDGSTFVYSFNDEIVIIARNDQNDNTTPWYDNNIQKICSVSGAIASLEFNKFSKSASLPLVGDPIFTSNTFIVPSLTEAINVLICKQQEAFQSALHLACFYELNKKYDATTVKHTLTEKNLQAKADLLRDECNIDFNKYPLSFKRGFACYRTPKVISTERGDEIKNKLVVDVELPIFTKDPEFLSNMFKSGRDIFRANRDIQSL